MTVSRSRPERALHKRAAFATLAICVGFAVASAGGGPRSGESFGTASADTAPGAYADFEGPQVHPLARTPDGSRLLAVNTPAGTLSVFSLANGDAPTLVGEIPVGLEPVSVAARSDHEAWVVNWLSDSVSVVDLDTGNVARTIDVGDEPADVVFAGPAGATRAFVSVAGLGQVKVFDPSAPGASPRVVPVRGKQPRALARDASGSRVFVSVFESGNRTTVVSASDVKAAGGPPAPKPALAAGLPKPPSVGLIVQQKRKRWVDDTGKGKWKRYVPYTLADVDVAVIDAAAAEPRVASEIHGVGTAVGNAAFDAAADRLYVANAEAHNVVRFEPNLRGRFVDTRVSIVGLSATPETVDAVDLNAHVDYANAAGSQSERDLSLALPADVALAPDGSVYIAATGSNKVGVLDASGAVVARVAVGPGPTGLALDAANERLYVLNRFDDSLSVVDTAARAELGRVSLGANPEPAAVRDGRPILYDATFSAHGTVACASCHLGGHVDGLAWDLGDPTGRVESLAGGTFLGVAIPNHAFHPMKGPMTTQSLRGITGTEPLHWRGDRAGLDDFNPAFVSLLGAPRELDPAELARFKAFVTTLAYPPNPNENLDRTEPDSADGPSAARGREVYLRSGVDRGILSCNQCHTVSPGFGRGTNSVIFPGFVLLMENGTGESQDFKVPQLRGLYEKVGMSKAPGEHTAGFGYTHDGAVADLLSFLRTPNFTFRNGDADRHDLIAFLMALDTGTAPAVGLQVTANGSNRGDDAVAARVALLALRADAGDCDLVVKGVYAGERRGFVYAGGGVFRGDTAGGPTFTAAELLAAAGDGAELTFTGVPAGSGEVRGVDRDGDGTLDGDE